MKYATLSSANLNSISVYLLSVISVIGYEKASAEPGGTVEAWVFDGTRMLSDVEAEGREDGGECGESDVDDYAPLVLILVGHNLLIVYGLRFIVYGKP